MKRKREDTESLSSETTTALYSTEALSSKTTTALDSTEAISSETTAALYSVECVTGSLSSTLEQLEHVYGVSFPREVYYFYLFACQINKHNPLEAFLPSLNIRLVGCFEIIHNSFEVNEKQIHLHYRFFFDPPEFMTVMYKPGDNKHEHWGYWRDKPSDDPNFVAHSSDSKKATLSIFSRNIFGALLELATRVDLSHHLIEDIKTFCKSNKIDIELNDSRSLMKKRKKEITASSFNNLGIVVDIDKRTEVGYRPLGITDKELTNLLDSIANKNGDTARLRELINWANIANDESDFGMSLHLGINIFCSFSRFTKAAGKILSTSYTLLGRELYSDIVKMHCRQRCDGLVTTIKYE